MGKAENALLSLSLSF